MPKDMNSSHGEGANKLFDLPMNLEAGQVNTLSFSQDAISSMQLKADGMLEISFRDGSKLLIEDFDELANSAKSCGRDTLIQLSDNTIIYPEDLYAQLKNGPVNFNDGQSGVVAIDMPKPGEVDTHAIDPGHEYKFSFDLDRVDGVRSGNNLVMTFENGGILILNNYFAAVGSDLPPVMTLADGATINADALINSCKLAEVPSAAELAMQDVPPQAEVATIEPAAGAEAAPSLQEVAQNIAPTNNGFSSQNLANIEPAAGADEGAVSSGRGYGFNSSVDGVGNFSLSPIGAIAATSLQYDAPRVVPNPGGIDEDDSNSGPPTPPDIDTVPTAEDTHVQIDETRVDDNGNDVVTGTVNVDFGDDGVGNVEGNGNFVSSGSQAGGALTSNGVPVEVTLVNGTYVGMANGQIVFTLEIRPDGTYTFTQLGALDHADGDDKNDVIRMEFGYTATDGDGDSVDAEIVVRVFDDAPVAVDDTATIPEGSHEATGNVLDNDDMGNDGAGAGGAVTSVNFNGTNYDIPPGGQITIVGQYGTLVMNSDGSYTYTSSNSGTGTDHFIYTITDYDGDTSEANLDIEVNDIDTVPTAEDTHVQIDETRVDDNGNDVVSGTVNVDFGDDGVGNVEGNGNFVSSGSQAGGALTSNGFPVEVTLVNGTYVGMANGQIVFTLEIRPDGTYTFTQLGALDHADGDDKNDVIRMEFGYTATDGDGDSVDAEIVVRVFDDAPVAVDDTATLPEGSHEATGNVLDNDDMGEDGAGAGGAVTSVNFNGTNYDIPPGGQITIVGQYGTLVMNSDGSYTYTSSNSGTGTDRFNYTITDYDGDTSEAHLDVEVNDIDTVPIVGRTGNSAYEKVVDDNGSQTLTGHVNVDFQDDGPGKIEVDGSFSSYGAKDNGKLTSNGVPVEVHMEGNTYIGMAGGVEIFRMTINADGSYTYVQSGLLDHADGGGLIHIRFGYTATDEDGDTVSGKIDIGIHDELETEDVLAQVSLDQVVVTDDVLGNTVMGNDSVLGVHSAPLFIADFQKEEGDTLDLSGLVHIEDGVTASIHDFVYAREVNGNTIISVNPEGDASGIAVDVAVLQGVVGVSVEEIIQITHTQQNQSGLQS